MKLRAVRLHRDLRGRCAAYQDFFQAPVEAEGLHNALVFSPKDLALPNATGPVDENLDNLLLRFVKPTIEAPPAVPALEGDLRDAIQHQLLHGVPELKAVAGRLGMSARTLQRRLADRDLAFSDLVRDTRCELAATYLKQPHLSITEISMMLGFQDPGALTRAFRKWYGLPPREYRRKYRV